MSRRHRVLEVADGNNQAERGDAGLAVFRGSSKVANATSAARAEIDVELAPKFPPTFVHPLQTHRASLIVPAA